MNFKATSLSSTIRTFRADEGAADATGDAAPKTSMVRLANEATFPAAAAAGAITGLGAVVDPPIRKAESVKEDDCDGAGITGLAKTPAKPDTAGNLASGLAKLAGAGRTGTCTGIAAGTVANGEAATAIGAWTFAGAACWGTPGAPVGTAVATPAGATSSTGETNAPRQVKSAVSLSGRGNTGQPVEKSEVPTSTTR